MSAPPPPPPPSYPGSTPQPPRKGFPVWLIVLLVLGICSVPIIGILAAIAVPSFTAARARARATVDLQNMRQLSMAMMQMDMDGNGDKTAGFPGDLAEGAMKLGQPAPVRTVSDYLQRIVEHKYLAPADLKRITARSPQYAGWNPDQPGAGRDCAVKIYKFRSKDSSDTIALTSREFSYGMPLSTTKVYAIVHKDGSGIVYRGREPLTNAGVLPGRNDYNDRPVETPEDSLVQE